MFPNFPALPPTSVREEDLVDDLTTLSILCNESVPTSPTACHKFEGHMTLEVASSLSVSESTEPFQSIIPDPDPDPFVQTATMHIPLPQRKHDLPMMHDHLKKQCFLRPVALSPYVSPEVLPAASLSETPVKKSSLVDNGSLKASSFPFPESPFTFSVTPRVTKDTLHCNSNNPEREPLVAGVPPRSQSRPRPESDCCGEQRLRPRRRSTGETVLLDCRSTLPPSIQQHPLSAPTKHNVHHSASDLCYVETHVDNESISTDIPLWEPTVGSSLLSTPSPKRLPSRSLMVTPNRSRVSSVSSTKCGAPTSSKRSRSPCRNQVRVSEAYFDGLGKPFEGLCPLHNPLSPTYRGSLASPSPTHHTQRPRTNSSASQNQFIPPTAEVKVRCDGSSHNLTTGRWERCTRHAIPVLAIDYRLEQDEQDEQDGDYDKDAPIRQFCQAHRNLVLKGDAVFPSSKVLSDPAVYNDYIPRYLHAATQAALRCMMEVPPSKSDRPGYIYAFHLQARKDVGQQEGKHLDEDTVFLKIGRAVNVSKRIDNWAKQCPSKMQTLRGYWPFPTQQSADGLTCASSLIQGQIMPEDVGAFHHKVERLVHIELADLVVNRQYLEPDFEDMKLTTDTKELASSLNAPNSAAGKRHLHRVKCSDCSRVHREIFPLTRIRDGKNKNGEWEYVVKPVIKRWGDFAAKYYVAVS